MEQHFQLHFLKNNTLIWFSEFVFIVLLNRYVTEKVIKTMNVSIFKMLKGG